MREIKFRAWDKETKKMMEVFSMEFDIGRESYKIMNQYGNIIRDVPILLAHLYKYKKGNRYEGEYDVPLNRTNGERNENIIIQQYIGLKDKNGLTDIFEDDIIDSNGNIKGNIYQMDKGKTDFIIQGFGTKDWCETYRRAILLGCKNAK